MVKIYNFGKQYLLTNTGTFKWIFV